LNQNLQVLTETLQNILPHASIKATELSDAGGIKLWLIDPTDMDCALTEQQTDAAWEAPPYWSFCWGSGLALARRILQNPSLVTGKTILDFGTGSGVVGIAAVVAGAKRVILCDIDPIAKISCEENLALNGLKAEFLEDFFALPEPVDLLFAADVLYDPENIPLVAKFRDGAKSVLVADSRVKNFSCEGYEKIDSCYSVTEPDLGENEDVKTVRFYQA
jgi:predicted nicotinamide N-methyase